MHYFKATMRMQAEMRIWEDKELIRKWRATSSTPTLTQHNEPLYQLHKNQIKLESEMFQFSILCRNILCCACDHFFWKMFNFYFTFFNISFQMKDLSRHAI